MTSSPPLWQAHAAAAYDSTMTTRCAALLAEIVADPNRRQAIFSDPRDLHRELFASFAPPDHGEYAGAYRGSADDLRDGYIHFSTASQVPGTAAKYFEGQKGLFLVAVDADALGDALRWEPSRGGQLFPHLYGELDFDAVISVTDLPLRSDGSHTIPDLMP